MNYRYLTSTKPLKGRIKQFPQDFVVEEICDNYQTSVKYLPDKQVDFIDWDLIFEKKLDYQNYLIVDFEKHNISTPKAISEISRFLKISKSRISYAGLKDKRSLSSQKISLYNPDKERLKKFKFKDIRIYNPYWSENKINIGDLKENKFTITIRQIQDLSYENIKNILDQAFKEIKQNGLINYFGEQRFGGARNVTAKVGKELLLKNYKKAVMLYLTYPSEYESLEVTNARKDIKENENFKKYVNNFPSKTGYERQLLNHLVSNPDDYLGAFKILPKTIQFLFLHAYQSYLFNEIINLRIDKGYGLSKIDGDKIIEGKINLQLFGYNSKFSDFLAGDLEKEIFKKEGVNFKHFFNKDYFVFSVKGDFRKLITFPKELKLIDISDDDLNQDDLPGAKKVTISFILEKGQYATVLIRELIKLENIG